MSIRESNKNELNTIRWVHEDAFGESEGKVVAQLACEILMEDSANPVLSLVAEDGEKIVGNIIFSPVKVGDSKEYSVFILAPLAIAKKSQRQGWGMKLIKKGLEMLKIRNADIVLVLGDPKYYSRAGFNADHGIEPPYKLAYPEAWMALELEPGMLKRVKGVAKCVLPLNAPEHW